MDLIGTTTIEVRLLHIAVLVPLIVSATRGENCLFLGSKERPEDLCGERHGQFCALGQLWRLLSKLWHSKRYTLDRSLSQPHLQGRGGAMAH